MTIPQALRIAVQRHQAGRLLEAEGIYRQILAAQPDHADALHMLGLLASQAGRHESAADLIRRAIAVNPAGLHYHLDLGNALAAQGRFDEVIAMFHAVLQTHPDYAEIHNNLGAMLRAKGRLDEAIASYRRALQINPDYADAHNNLGVALHEKRQFAEAVGACRRALQIKPDHVEAWYNLGIALQSQGHRDEAIGAYRRALQIKPDHKQALNNLGSAQKDRGNLDDAVAAYRRALQIQPDYVEALNNLGAALKDQGELDEAIGTFRRALQIMPDHPGMHSNLVFALHFHPDHDGRSIAEEHQRWNRQFSDPVKQFLLPHANDRSPERRLRVGYVSPDFRDHAVGRYVLPLFERHDRARFEILCYSGVVRPDWMTERFRVLADGWRDTAVVSDARLAEMIREDGVDILVDLALHTAGNRLPVFARQPAPVQVSWLGHPGGTGLPGIGYRLTDAHMEPSGEAPAWSGEEPVRLPDCCVCYLPPDDSPEINALPALSAEGVTFGSLNNFTKVHEGVLALWARVLDAVKGSRLLMRCPEGRTRERVRAFFGARGIVPERVELAGYFSGWEHLRLYQRIDLGLDPFPYNGMSTTCEALWMGAPVLTLPGETPVSRAGLSLLSSIGLGELAASSEEDFVRMAAELAGNLPHLADLRATLRARMQASPLMDAPRFARNVEAAYRSMWERWRAGH